MSTKSKAKQPRHQIQILSDEEIQVKLTATHINNPNRRLNLNDEMDVRTAF
jgi:hypothetical protein